MIVFLQIAVVYEFDITALANDAADQWLYRILDAERVVFRMVFPGDAIGAVAVDSWKPVVPFNDQDATLVMPGDGPGVQNAGCKPVLIRSGSNKTKQRLAVLPSPIFQTRLYQPPQFPLPGIYIISMNVPRDLRKMAGMGFEMPDDLLGPQDKYREGVLCQDI